MKMTERRLILTGVGFALAVGAGIAYYGFFHWIIPFLDDVVFPWMADLEKTVPRAQGLTILIALFLAVCGAVIALCVFYMKYVRRLLKDASDRERLRKA